MKESSRENTSLYSKRGTRMYFSLLYDISFCHLTFRFAIYIRSVGDEIVLLQL